MTSQKTKSQSDELKNCLKFQEAKVSRNKGLFKSSDTVPELDTCGYFNVLDHEKCYLLHVLLSEFD